MKKFTSFQDVHSLDELVQRALLLKRNHNLISKIGEGKTLGLLFFNPSLRTRISSQIAAHKLGLNCIVLNANQETWNIEFEDGTTMNGSSVEHIKEMARVLNKYFDILGVRVFPELKNKKEDIEEKKLSAFIKYFEKPIISLESNTLHPLQSFADILTIEELKTKPRPKVVLTWVPHIKPIPHCVANSFSEWVKNTPYEFVITHPKAYELDEKYTHGVPILNNQKEAFENADFIYAKNWSCFTDYGTIQNSNDNWKLTEAHLENTNQAKIMHCLPVRRNLEIEDKLLDSPNCIVGLQAENRIWSCLTILEKLLKNKG